MQKLTRWGNSVGIRIPAHVLGAAGLKSGDHVHVRLMDSGDIRLRPVKHIQPADQNLNELEHPNLKIEEEW